ncbi:MAG: hypothetical protein WCI50_05820 [Actinomycetes bacterium]
MLDRLSTTLARKRTVVTVLLLAWAAYEGLSCTTNATELASSWGWFDIAFRSGNVSYLTKATGSYFTSPGVSEALLAVIVLGQLLVTVLLVRAVARAVRGRDDSAPAARAALVLTALQWLVFAVAVEVFVSYRVGVTDETFMILAATALATLVVVELLPDRSGG